MSPKSFVLAFVLASLPSTVIAACSSSSSSPATGGDSGGGGQDAGFDSKCGNPGDQGNELGIGKFCKNQQDCVNNQSATLCSILGDDTTHFCTKTCKNPDGGEAGADECGTATACTCNEQGQCGCTPTKCLK